MYQLIKCGGESPLGGMVFTLLKLRGMHQLFDDLTRDTTQSRQPINGPIESSFQWGKWRWTLMDPDGPWILGASWQSSPTSPRCEPRIQLGSLQPRVRRRKHSVSQQQNVSFASQCRRYSLRLILLVYMIFVCFNASQGSLEPPTQTAHCFVPHFDCALAVGQMP